MLVKMQHFSQSKNLKVPLTYSAGIGIINLLVGDLITNGYLLLSSGLNLGNQFLLVNNHFP